MKRLIGWWICSLVLCTNSGLLAETYRLSLPQAVDRAMKQNPQVVIARLNEQKVNQQTIEAQDPFSTKVQVGSGLASGNGFPLGIENAAPSIVRASVTRTLFNRPLTYAVAEAKELARGSAIGSAATVDDAGYQAASAFLDAAGSAASIRGLKNQIPAWQRSLEVISAKVEGGQILPIEQKKAQLMVARVEQRLRQLEQTRQVHLHRLAILCGLKAEDELELQEAASAIGLPQMTEEQALDSALRWSPELKKLQSDLLAKGFARKKAESANLPQADLVAQYALFARFNRWDDYFQRFTRNNYQVGVSLRLPVWNGSASRAAKSIVDLEVQRLEAQMSDTRSRISVQVRESLAEMRVLEANRNLARMEMDVAREEVSVLLAQFEEGRVALDRLEQQRTVENERWLEFLAAQTLLEKGKLRVLKETGQVNLLAQQ
jgi:outer membrane protein